MSFIDLSIIADRIGDLGGGASVRQGAFTRERRLIQTYTLLGGVY